MSARGFVEASPAIGRRELAMLGGLGLLIVLTFAQFGGAFGVRMLAEAACYALIALGLTLQWGYAGLFNVGVMGFVALGAFGLTFLSTPIDPVFWSSAAAGRLLGGAALIAAAALVAWALAARGARLGLPAGPAKLIGAAVLVIGVGIGVNLLAPAIEAIESGEASTRGFIGGLGLPAGFGWLFGAGLAALAGWAVARVCLGLRSDYLAIATLGAAELIRAVLKNEDWLTRGTSSVSPLPWPTPTPREMTDLLGAPDLSFELARGLHLMITALLIAGLFFLLDRAYRAPWGRMIRAIRDNETAAAALGKDVDGRRLEIFVLGAALMGLGGAALIGFAQVFDPTSFQPLNHTFLIWVMVIVGGSGNNFGALFGALFVYFVWIMSEPATLWLFQNLSALAQTQLGWEAPSDLAARALQSRLIIIGLTIALALRYAPSGAFPERPPKPF